MNALVGIDLDIVEAAPGAAPLRPTATPGETLVRKPHRLGLGEAVRFGPLLGPFLLLLAWATGSAAGLIDPRVLPAPWTTLATAGDLIADGRLQTNLAVSALRAAQGFGWGVAAGVLV